MQRIIIKISQTHLQMWTGSSSLHMFVLSSIIKG